MDLTKEIKLTKKLIVFLLLLNVIVIGISYSYALFEVSVVKNNIVKLQTANIIMTLTSTDLENNKSLTLSGNETKEITLTITNESEINALARLYYIGDGDLTFTSDTDFKDEENIGIGEINKGESKTITIEITNNSASSVTIELGAQEGLIGYELTLNEGRNSIVLEPGAPTLTDVIVAKLGTDGIVAVNTGGTLYDGTGTIREYRYSGASVNNYMYFNCKDSDGTYNYGDLNYNYASNCETWRVVGVFEEDGEQGVKIMRNTMLSTGEVPSTYTINGTTYTMIPSSSGGGSNDYEPTIDNLLGTFMRNGIIRLATSTTPQNVVWNSTKTGTNYNDWTTAGLQYFLNTESDTNGTTGYLGTLSDNAKNLIQTTTYNLGNVNNDSSGATAITAYTQERGTTDCASSVTSNTHSSSCYIWYGNQPTWSGKVALLYPSDYGYAASSSYWSTVLYNYDGSSVKATNWMQAESNHTRDEWLLSPSSFESYYVLRWYSTGAVVGGHASNTFTGDCIGARPVVNLISGAKWVTGTGESSSPYVIINGL